jgi:hypothetical protein
MEPFDGLTPRETTDMRDRVLSATDRLRRRASLRRRVVAIASAVVLAASISATAILAAVTPHDLDTATPDHVANPVVGSWVSPDFPRLWMTLEADGSYRAAVSECGEETGTWAERGNSRVRLTPSDKTDDRAECRGPTLADGNTLTIEGNTMALSQPVRSHLDDEEQRPATVVAELQRIAPEANIPAGFLRTWRDGEVEFAVERDGKLRGNDGCVDLDGGWQLLMDGRIVVTPGSDMSRPSCERASVIASSTIAELTPAGLRLLTRYGRYVAFFEDGDDTRVAQATKGSVVGEWREESAELTFFEDGTFDGYNSCVPLDGDWHVREDGGLSLDTGTRLDDSPICYMYSRYSDVKSGVLIDDELVLHDADGDVVATLTRSE